MWDGKVQEKLTGVFSILGNTDLHSSARSRKFTGFSFVLSHDNLFDHRKVLPR